MNGYPKELPCRAQCTGPGIQWCLTKYDAPAIAWHICIDETHVTINEGFPLDPSTISIINNNTLAIKRVNSVFQFVHANCSILDKNNGVLCSSGIELNVVLGT